MSTASRMNPERVLSDAMLDGRRKGRWFEELGVTEARYRLNGTQTRFLVDGWISDTGEKAFGPTPLTSLHTASVCGNKRRSIRNRPCVVHSPSGHGMRGWPLIWDQGHTQMLRLCPHDIEHPDPDDVSYWVDVLGQHDLAEHDCCTSCFPDQKCFTTGLRGSVIQPPLQRMQAHVWR